MGTRRVKRLGIVAAVVTAVAVLAACTSSSKPKAAPGLEARTVKLGGLEVTITLTRIDASGAAFRVAFDTHTGAPTIDVAANSTFTVNGTAWRGAAWSGDGPGGHHRVGTLRFSAAGPATGRARLRIAGLSGSVDVTWSLSSS